MSFYSSNVVAPKQAVILCGGLGTRLKPFTNHLPKPMVDCNGHPFLFYLMEQLKEQGISRFLLLTGYLSYKIKDFFGDGSNWGWNIKYSEGPISWDTGRRLWEAKDYIDESFMILYSDNFIPFSLEKLVLFHKEHSASLTLSIARKKSGNISINNDGFVEVYDNSRNKKDLGFVEIGYMLANKNEIFESFEYKNCNFSDVIKNLVSYNKVRAFFQDGDYHSISDPERWSITAKYLLKKKIILIDRDGVINEKAPRGEYISKWEDFKYIRENVEGMEILAKSGFSFIIVTNQAGLARKMIDENDLNVIHKNLVADLKKRGIKILKIYMCPHHWDENCKCRKPKPGMLFEASTDLFLRLDKTIFVGDDMRDCEAAYLAGCKSIFLGKESLLSGLKSAAKPMICSETLKEVVPEILEFFN
ncbi:MAG: hypothetical protein CBC25_04395 [Pelagibacteraceae bacterium TMED65]|nr:MAG: hypothetical protein CBC25_04395 [Pelagibacteraceae bacterium TMED65]|tara:strand:+ start:4724 stop:5974 length:1251 start_codon:yes stop_codon:yes gene_type:complete